MKIFLGERLRHKGALVALVASAFLCACQQTGSAPKLQAHLAAAKTSATETTRHVESVKNSIERIDYKAGRAKKLLDEGFDK